jgi:hypothetical protein
MGRVYSAAFKSITVIHGWMLSQTTETGDAAEEMLLLTTNRGVGSVTSGSGGAAVTPQPREDQDSAYGGTIERNNTTVMAAGSGTLEELEVYAWNVRVPFQMVYPPELRPVIAPGNRWTLEMESTPADSITMSGVVWLEEIG